MKKNMMLSNAYQHVYQPPTAPLYATTTAGPAHAGTAITSSPISAISDLGARISPQSAPHSGGPSAAVALGLVELIPSGPSKQVTSFSRPYHASQPQHVSIQSVQSSLPPQGYAPAVSSPTIPSHNHGAPMMHTAQPLMSSMGAYSHPPSSLGMAPPSPPLSAPQVLSSTVTSGLPQRTMPPPPPTAPAPMMASPVGGSARMPPLTSVLSTPKGRSPTSPEHDMKVLLDLAMASGNQEAVDAVMRQAQQNGVSTDQLRTGY